MSRGQFGRPRGRFFSTKDEHERLNRGMELFQNVHGTEVDWWFFEHIGATKTVVDDIYDEGLITGGKKYHGPRRIPVLSAMHRQGEELNDDRGMQTFDHVTLRVSYEQARRAGLDLDVLANREELLHDRFVLRGRVFDVESIQTAGQFDSPMTPTVMHVTATQVRDDELYDSKEFQRYIGQSLSEP
jgi:hypothetical protein